MSNRVFGIFPKDWFKLRMRGIGEVPNRWLFRLLFLRLGLLLDFLLWLFGDLYWDELPHSSRWWRRHPRGPSKSIAEHLHKEELLSKPI
jgi:hypothetical protein